MCKISCVLIENSRICRAVLVEKVECESKRKVSFTFTRFAANSQSPLTGGSSCECQTVTRDNLGPEVAAILFKTLSQTAPLAIQKSLERSFCLTKCFEKNWQLFLALHHVLQLSGIRHSAPMSSEIYRNADMKCHNKPFLHFHAPFLPQLQL